MNQHPLSIIIFLLGLITITLVVGFLAQRLDPFPSNEPVPEMTDFVATTAPTTKEESRSQVGDEEMAFILKEMVDKGYTAARQQHWDEALQDFRNAYRLAPNHRIVVLGLGRLLAQIGQDQEAMVHFEKALELSQTNQEKAEIHSHLGLFLKKRNRHDEAITQFESLVSLQPQQGNAFFHLGDLNRSNGRFQIALEHYIKALQTHPGHAPSRMGRSFCLIRLHRFEEARARLEEDIRFFPKETTFFHALARILAAAPTPKVRNGGEALSITKDLIRQLGIYPQLAETLAMAMAELGHYEQAEDIQAKAITHVGLDFPQKRVDQMEKQRQGYAAKQPCRQPWQDDDPIFYRNSYEPEKITEHNRSDRSWKAPKLDMVTRLTQISQQVDISQMIYLNRARAKKLSEQLDAIHDLETFLVLQPQYATELLRAGKSIAAKQALEKIQTVLSRNQKNLEGDPRYNHLHALALTNFRLGEQENCQAIHSPDSCILPIRGGGIHQIQRGSRAAIDLYTQILAGRPNDLKARWFLNLAYMTVGEYPEGVPTPHLIDPETFDSDVTFPRFPDTATEIGLDLHSLAGSVICDDFDNDGLLDLFISQWGLQDQVQFYRNRGDGSFEKLTEKAGLLGITSGLNIMQTDYNNDGFLDVFMLRGAWMGKAGEHPNSLLRNNGDNTFTDVTEAAGLLSFRPTQTATWLDYNNDGHIDVFIGNESGRTTYPCELFQNQGDGTFREVAKEAGVADIGHTKAVSSGDYDGDGRIDLFLSRYGEINRLYRNLGPNPTGDKSIWRFENTTKKAGVGKPIKSFPAWFFDFDNDGHLDLFISDYSNTGLRGVVADLLGQDFKSERARLYRNLGNGQFEDVTQQAGLFHPFVTMGSNFGDIDNDGYPDFYLGTGTPLMNMLVPNRMFRNEAGKTFSDVTFSGGFGHLQKGHGISFADLDNDGDQDIYAVMGGAFDGDAYPNAFFQNPGFGHHWLKIALQGQISNRSGIGARIAVRVRNGNNPPRTIYKTVNSGGSFGSNPLRQELGLGPNAKIEQLEVFWPASSTTQRFTNLGSNRLYLIQENQDVATVVPIPKLKLGGSQSAGHHHPE